MKKAILLFIFQLCSLAMFAQINTDRVLTIGRNALYFEDYVLSIQYFNQVIKSKPWLAEPYFYRAVAKINLDDYKGAEEDCTLCLERNPFLVQAYYARGIARQSQEKFDEAIEDYRKGLEFKAEDRQMLVNVAVANIQKKDFKEAEKVFDELMTAHPKYSMNYLTREPDHQGSFPSGGNGVPGEDGAEQRVLQIPEKHYHQGCGDPACGDRRFF